MHVTLHNNENTIYTHTYIHRNMYIYMFFLIVNKSIFSSVSITKTDIFWQLKKTLFPYRTTMNDSLFRYIYIYILFFNLFRPNPHFQFSIHIQYTRIEQWLLIRSIPCVLMRLQAADTAVSGSTRHTRVIRWECGEC